MSTAEGSFDLTPPDSSTAAAAKREYDHVVQKAVVAHLVGHHGWYPDRIWPNWAGKNYKTFLGHSRASIAVFHDPVNRQFFLRGEFTSAGENAMGLCFCCIRESATEQEIRDAVDAYIVDAEKGIAQAYSVRLLRTDAEDDATHETETNAERNA